MSAGPVICLGQQPCGFFPRRFLYAKLQTARRVQAEIGGEIVLFLHDSDHDPRETQTIEAPLPGKSGGMYIKVTESLDEKVVAGSAAGYLYTTVVS